MRELRPFLVSDPSCGNDRPGRNHGPGVCRPRQGGNGPGRVACAAARSSWRTTCSTAGAARSAAAPSGSSSPRRSAATSATTRDHSPGRATGRLLAEATGSSGPAGRSNSAILECRRRRSAAAAARRPRGARIVVSTGSRSTTSRRTTGRSWGADLVPTGSCPATSRRTCGGARCRGLVSA